MFSHASNPTAEDRSLGGDGAQECLHELDHRRDVRGSRRNMFLD
jgi:hypothetical protein